MDTFSQRIKADCVLQEVRREVRVSHRLLDIRVTEYPLQRDDIPSVHHKVRCKCVAHDMGGLSFR